MKKILLLMLMIATICISGFAQNIVTVTVGDTTTSSETYSVPFDNFYKNTWTQTIYAADEIGMAGLITSIAYQVGSTPSSADMFSTVHIYMGTTSASVNTSTSWLPMGDLTEVYSTVNMPLPTTSGWQVIALDQPFVYDGSDNLVIVISKTMSAYNSGLKYKYTSVTASTIYRQSDSDVSYASHPGTNSGTLSAYRPNLKLTLTVGTDFCYPASNVSASNLTSSSATITWNSSSTAYNYILQYKTENQPWSAATAVDVYDTTYDLTGLSSPVTYNVRVAADCGGDTSGWKSTTFVTPCTALSTLPFTENFDSHTGATTTSASSNNLPYCWSYLNAGTSTSYSGYPIIYASATYAASGSNSLRFYTYTTSGTYDDQMAILPQIDPTLYPVSSLQLSFDARNNSSYTFTVVVGVIANPMDKTTFVPVDTIVTTSNTYANFEFPFSQYTGPEGFIAIMAPRPSSSYNAGYIDNIMVDLIPSCPKPQDVTSSNPTQSSIDLSWNEIGSATTWEIEYGPTGFTQGDGTVVIATTNPFTINGLESSLVYDFYVRADCGGGDYSNYTIVYSAGTECAAVTTLPLLMNFDSLPGSTSTSAAVTNLPYCWSTINNGTSVSYSGYPIIYASATYAASGNNSMRFYTFTTSGTYDDQMVILPEIDPTLYPMNNLQLSFDARNNSTYTFQLVVGVMTDPTDKTTFVPMDTIITTSNTYANYEIPFSQYTGTGSYIAMMAPRPASSYNSGYVDNIMVDIIPSCPKPKDLTTSNPTVSSIDLAWNEMGTATAWEIEYGPMGFTQGNGTVVNASSNPFTVSGLEHSTGYDFYVRAICGGDNNSYWSSKHTAATACAPISDLPLTETFDTYAGYTTTTGSVNNLPYCWSHLNTGTTSSYTGYPIIYTSATYASSGSNSMRFYTYTTSGSYDDQMAILPQIDVTSIPMNTLQVSFDARNYSSYTFKLVVGVMTDPTDKTTFVPFDTIITTSNTYANYVVSFDQYTGSGSYIAMMAPRPTSSYNSGYVDNIIVELIPSCPRPTHFTATSTPTDEVILSWTDNNASQWDILYGQAGFDPTVAGEGTLLSGITTNPYTLSGLTPGIYDFYLRSDCGGGDFSEWTLTPETASPFTYSMGISGTDTITGCDFIVTDDGGISGDYSNNCNYTLVIYPGESDSVVSVSGTFVGESSIDYLSVYDGTSADENNLLQKVVSGTTGTLVTFGPLTSTSGPITLFFHSDGSVVRDGFAAQVSCVEAPDCPKPYDVHMLNVTNDEATVAWSVMDGFASSFNVVISTFPGFNPDTCTNVINVYTNDCTFSGLTPYTNYYVMVQSDCSNDVSEWSNVIGFRTACDPITTLPFIENFDSSTGTSSTTASTSNLPYCWNNINAGTSTSYSGYPIIYSSSTYAASGSNSMRFYAYTTAGTYDDQIAVLPLIDPTLFPLNTLQLSFDARNYSTYTFTVVVGVLSSPTDKSSFVPIDTIVTTSNSYTNYEILFNEYIGTGNYIAIMAPQPTSSYNAGYIDNIIVETIPSCHKPIDVTASGITSTSVNLSWTDVSDAFSWEIEYGAPGFTPGDTAGTIVQATSNPYLLNNLAPATTYDIYVRSDCGNDMSQNANVITITTGCVPVDALPFVENFDTYGTGTTVYPTCWKKINTYSSDRPYVNSTHYAGVGSLYFYATSTTYNVAVMPEFDITIPINTLQATFMYRATNSTDRMIVGVMTDPDDFSTFVAVDTVFPGSPVSTWIEREVNFNNYTGSGQYIAFYNGNPSATCYSYIDNLVVNLIPTCPKPQSVNILNTSINSIELEWTEVGSATSWEIAYGAPGFDPDGSDATIVTANSNPFTVTNLNTATTYDFYVRSACSSSELSYWSNSVQTSTTMIPTDLPYTANFSDDNDVWVLNNGSCVNYWTRGTVNNTSALFVTDNGTTPNYTLNSISVVSAQKLFTVGTADTITITYDVQVNGESSFDYMKMFLSPSTEQYPASTSTPATGTYGLNTYSNYAYDFYTNGYGMNASYHYIMNQATSTVHIVAKMPNPNASPTSTSTALLVFAWKNDVSLGNQPPATIFNLSVTANGSGPAITDPTVATTAATAIGQTTATLNGTINNPDNVTITAKGFEWKATAGGTYQPVTVTGNNLTYNLTGLTANTGYTYKAFITYNGTTVYGNEVTFNTLPEDVQPCNVPTGLTAGEVTKESIAISWDNDANVNSWNIQYRPVGGTLSSATSNTNSYTINGLQPETSYQIQVQANCGDGNLSEWSSAVTGTTTVGIDSWLSNSVSLYPNPAKEVVNVQCTMNNVQIETVEVFDVYGKLLNTVIVTENPTRINVSGLANGMYFVRVTTEQGVATKSFVKK